MNKLFCALTHVAKSVQSRATSARVYYILKHVCAYVRKYINVIKKETHRQTTYYHVRMQMRPIRDSKCEGKTVRKGKQIYVPRSSQSHSQYYATNESLTFTAEYYYIKQNVIKGDLAIYLNRWFTGRLDRLTDRQTTESNPFRHQQQQQLIDLVPP